MINWIVLISVWAVTILLYKLMIPRDKRRIAHAAFLFKQMMTWLLGLVVVELELLSYPVRFLAQVNRTSFSFEFFLYPAICGIFNANYPSGRGRRIEFFYLLAYCSVLTGLEVLIKTYTSLIKYTGWAWYWSWISIGLTLFVSRLFCVWFFKTGSVRGDGGLPDTGET